LEGFFIFLKKKHHPLKAFRPKEDIRRKREKQETHAKESLALPSLPKPISTSQTESKINQPNQTKPHPKGQSKKSKRPNQRPNDSETNSKRIRNEAEASLNAKPGEVTRRRSP
jgi:hypothetical protein